jgi:hypothetical protein
MPNALSELVRAARRRLRRGALAEALGAGVLLAGVMAAAGRILLPQSGQLDALLSGVMVGAAFAMVRYVSRRPDELTAAIACDRAAGVAELFSTAWALPAAGGSDPAWHAAILAQAQDAAAQVNVDTALHRAGHPGRVIVGLMLLFSAAIWPGAMAPTPELAQPQMPQSLAGGRADQDSTRAEDAGATVAWSVSSARWGGSAADRSHGGGPEMLSPADADARIARDARQIDEASGQNASSGHGGGSGFSKGSAPQPLSTPLPGGASARVAASGTRDADGAASPVSPGSAALASTDGRIVGGSSHVRATSPLGDSVPVPAGPSASAIASVPAPYRAAVREYFNR